MLFFKKNIFYKVTFFLAIVVFLILFFNKDSFSNYFYLLLQKYYSFSAKVSLNNSLLRERELLSRKIAKQKILLNNVKTLKQENEQLKELLEVKKESIFEKELIYANVIAIAPENYFYSFKIDKGKQEKITKDSLVIFFKEKNFLIGNITKVFKNYSIVNTIYHPDFQLPVIIGEKKEIGILKSFSFKNNFNLSIHYVKKNMDIQTNMNVWTLGNSEKIPADIYIGKIAKVTKEEYFFFQKIEIKQKDINIFNIKEVFIVQ